MVVLLKKMQPSLFFRLKRPTIVIQASQQETPTMKITNEKDLVQAIREYLAQGMNPAEICLAVDKRGVICYAVGIELLIKKYNLK